MTGQTRTSYSREEIVLSIAIPMFCFGGTALGILLEDLGYIEDAGLFFWGCLVGAFLLAYLAWGKPRKDIVSLLAPMYAFIIFFATWEMKPTVILQLLFGISLTVLVVRLNRRFSTPPVKEQEEDPMEKYLYDYLHRITPFFRGIDRETAHSIASVVLSYKFELYPKVVASAGTAISRLSGEGAIAVARKAVTIIRDRAVKLDQSDVKAYSALAFGPGEEQYLAIIIPADQIMNRDDYVLDNAIVLAYGIAYLCSPDDGQMLDEHQNFIIQILSSYKEQMGR
ncbi:MAG TPA: hypothetical protein PLN56_06745 [Methanoregulaceae archaeon]|nr:MAG: hypothetical protein IPI71_07080 [Methanolinea sp.]HON81925.1 hypothetical protein [Methanoregulaceae archaeon]HPD10677.1 hypothetical protein [Methanoregulaceae archaeon]HRT15806.1 hypothetical protein [Methanoregulaceae archaeon]HRU31320.1 hypothetical protein [Methanoregulaceae archaeon]